MKKPAILRVIFILNALLVLICFVFYFVAKTKGNLPVAPENILYTAIGYVFNFSFIVASILKKKLSLLRTFILLIIAISFPTRAYIGILISLITFGLSFHKKVVAYFNS